MNEISLKEHQNIMLEIMKDFANFCEQNNLRYFLDAGTLLGAIRHKGFIPWDNDADVCMPRPDFDKFYKLLKEKDFKLNDHLLLELPENTIYTFFKLGDTRTTMYEFPNDVIPEKCYVYIDIFVKDGLPANLKKTKRICDKNEKLSLHHWFNKRSIKKWRLEHNFIKKIIAIIANILVRDKNRAYKKQKAYINKINRKYPYESCKYVSTLSNGEFYRICKKSNFDSFVYADFEGRKFRIPVGYDDWLRVLYGDSYMVVPPKEKQKVHNVIVEWNE